MFLIDPRYKHRLFYVNLPDVYYMRNMQLNE